MMTQLIRTFSTTCLLSIHISTAHASNSTVNATDFMKIRCNTKGENTITTWSGMVTTTGVAADKSQTLFKITGYNIARCFQDDAGQWIVASRELTFYLDPVSGSVLKEWKNPWTNEVLRVVPIANALVQQKIPASAQLPVESSDETSILRVDVPLSYPNPLAGDSRFSEYSPELFYKAHESFSYIFSRKNLETLNTVDTVQNVQVSWTRVSPWLPWMKMKGSAGQLVFNAIVQKASSMTDVSDSIRDQISKYGLDLYLDAPRCIVKNKLNVTSWTYFKEHFDSFAKGEEFPRPESSSRSVDECPNR